jgi:ParB family chromosome partitioning protein
MAEKRRPALGRGMAALLSNAAPPPSASIAIPGRTLLQLPIEAIERNPNQPRKRFEEEKLEELAASIREHGVVEPILVRREAGSYRILAGERRWRAAQRAGLKEIPAVLREASEREAFEIALVENLQREDLNAIEEAEAYEVLIADHRLTQDAIAQRVGKERSTVANALRLLKLPSEVRDLVRDGQLDMGHARALLGTTTRPSRRRPKGDPRGLSVRATEAARSLGREATARRPLRDPGVKALGQRCSVAWGPGVGSCPSLQSRAGLRLSTPRRRARRNTRRWSVVPCTAARVGGSPDVWGASIVRKDVLLDKAAGGGDVAGGRRGRTRSAHAREVIERGVAKHGHAEAR